MHERDTVFLNGYRVGDPAGMRLQGARCTQPMTRVRDGLPVLVEVRLAQLVSMVLM